MNSQPAERDGWLHPGCRAEDLTPKRQLIEIFQILFGRAARSAAADHILNFGITFDA
jgi:hypothetical protein